MVRLVVSLIVAIAAPGFAAAHGLGVEARLKAGTVLVEAYYDDNTSATDAKVIVRNEAGQVVHEGKTDAQGKWSFPAPPPGKYQIRINAGGGHAAKTTITIPGPAADEAAQVVTDGSTRAAATDPVRRLLLATVGVAVIVAIAVVVRSRLRAAAKKQSANSTTSGG